MPLEVKLSRLAAHSGEAPAFSIAAIGAISHGVRAVVGLADAAYDAHLGLRLSLRRWRFFMRTVTTLGFVGCALLVAGLTACSGSTGPQGPAGATGATGAPGGSGTSADGGGGSTGAASAGTVVPNVGLVGRELDVQVSGEDVTFDSTTTLDFGAGVTVSNIVVVSATTVSAHLAIDATAAIGDNDVSIKTGSTTIKATKGFHIESPVEVTVDGTLQQGGVALLELFDRDSHSFDTGSESDLEGNTTENFVVSGTGLTILETVGVTSTDADIVVIADPLATPGAVQLTAANAPNGQTTLSFATDPNAVTVAARTPVTLTPNMASAAQNLAAPFASGLFKLSTTGTSIVTTTLNVTGAMISPELIATRASGKFTDLLNSSTGAPIVFPTTGSMDTYFVVIDGALGGGASSDYGYTLEATSVAATAVTEVGTAHGTLLLAQDLGTLPAIPAAGSATVGGSVVTGTIASMDEVDVYKFTTNGTNNIEIALTATVDAELVVNTDGVTFTESDGFDPIDPTVQPLQVFSGFGETLSSDTTANGVVPTAKVWYVCVRSSDSDDAGGTGTVPTGAYTFSIRNVP
jgi:hypothetical protein